jgi:hypothetical protein
MSGVLLSNRFITSSTKAWAIDVIKDCLEQLGYVVHECRNEGELNIVVMELLADILKLINTYCHDFNTSHLEKSSYASIYNSLITTDKINKNFFVCVNTIIKDYYLVWCGKMDIYGDPPCFTREIESVDINIDTIINLKEEFGRFLSLRASSSTPRDKAFTLTLQIMNKRNMTKNIIGT